MSFLGNKATRVALDVGLLVGFVAEFVTREGPDYALHSWIGVALVPVICIHLATNWRWVKSTYRRRSAHPEWPLARFNAVFAAVTTVCVLSGFPIWLEWSDNGGWSAVHTITGFLAVLLGLSHLWRNRRRLVTLLPRRVASPAA